MLDVDTLLDGLPEDLTILFFAAFARFEYALMQAGLLLPSRRVAALAEANWNRLSHELGDGFFQEIRHNAAVSTLINAQPRKLIVRDGSAAFGPPLPIVTNTKQLLESARRVRNNLFHGNKLFAANRHRDQQLMHEVLWLIEFIMEKQPQIGNAFNEPQN